jgi:hypothetical protein
MSLWLPWTYQLVKPLTSRQSPITRPGRKNKATDNKMIFFPIFPPLESFPYPFPSGAGASFWTTAPSRAGPPAWRSLRLGEEREGEGEISNISDKDFAIYFTRFIFFPELP